MTVPTQPESLNWSEVQAGLCQPTSHFTPGRWTLPFRAPVFASISVAVVAGSQGGPFMRDKLSIRKQSREEVAC